tara:strand:+ start:1152 stop:1808 length:657 start_codon:yes stop_codon:yes gene_type:complete
MIDHPTLDRILIVDDHPLVRDGLRSLIAVTFDECDILEAANIEEALNTLSRQDEFDLVLLDFNVPDTSRLEGLKRIRSEYPMVPIVMVSGEFDRNIVREAVAVGAAGFIPKSLKRSAIVDALHRVILGEIYIPDMVMESTAESQEEDDILRRIESLTPQQRVVLSHLVRGRLNKQIAHDLDVSMTTVKAHVSAILQKLGTYSRTQAVILANRVHFENP